MEFVPWTSFARIVANYSGDALTMTLPCTEHFRAMAYAQLTWRESLRDIEATLGANSSKLYGMGFGKREKLRPLAMAARSIWAAEAIQPFLSKNSSQARVLILRQLSGTRKLARAIL